MILAVGPDNLPLDRENPDLLMPPTTGASLEAMTPVPASTPRPRKLTSPHRSWLCVSLSNTNMRECSRTLGPTPSGRCLSVTTGISFPESSSMLFVPMAFVEFNSAAGQDSRTPMICRLRTVLPACAIVPLSELLFCSSVRPMTGQHETRGRRDQGASLALGRRVGSVQVRAFLFES